MNCRRFEEELKKWDGLKALDIDAAFGEHLKSCPACQARRAEYGELFDALKADQLPMPEESYWASFPALVRERIEKISLRPRWKPILGWSLPVFAVVLVVGIALFVSKEKPDLANLTAEEAFDYNAPLAETVADLPLPENTVSFITAQAEEELVGSMKVEELVYTLSDEQLKTLEEKLTPFKL
ncbi:MAG: hypothetical protein L0196_09665 [candidate division Zixibacteria bacterium]|nr:hypothetical protein [candidate division Zixibacteria bacterium]